MQKSGLYVGVAIGVAIVAGGVLFRARARQQRSQGEVIGAYFVPDLPDWKKKAFHSEIVNNVTYAKMVDTDAVLAKVTEFATPRGAQSPTLAEIQRRESEMQHNADRAAEDKTKGFTSESETSHPGQFGAYPGIVVEMHTTRAGEAPSFTRTLRFEDGHDEYWLSIAYPENSTTARQLAEGAWNTLQSTMQHK